MQLGQIHTRRFWVLGVVGLCVCWVRDNRVKRDGRATMADEILQDSELDAAAELQVDEVTEAPSPAREAGAGIDDAPSPASETDAEALSSEASGASNTADAKQTKKILREKRKSRIPKRQSAVFP